MLDLERVAAPTINGNHRHQPYSQTNSPMLSSQVAFQAHSMNSTSLTSPLCVVHPEAQIGENVTISPFVTIGANVKIGEGTWIGPGAHIMDGARIGRNCKIFPGAIVGSIPQDLKYKGEKTTLEIGDNTIIREYCTLNIGTAGGGGRTVIGSNCLIMAYVHVAHDCAIGNSVILANNVTLAGHITIGDFAVLGGLAAVHQFVKIGEHTMIGGGSLVTCDVPPFVTAGRTPLAYAGVNRTGLKRRGYTAEQIEKIKDVYRVLFVYDNPYSKAIELIRKELPQSVERDTILHFLDTKSARGLIKGLSSRSK